MNIVKASEEGFVDPVLHKELNTDAMKLQLYVRQPELHNRSKVPLPNERLHSKLLIYPHNANLKVIIGPQGIKQKEGSHVQCSAYPQSVPPLAKLAFLHKRLLIDTPSCDLLSSTMPQTAVRTLRLERNGTKLHAWSAYGTPPARLCRCLRLSGARCPRGTHATPPPRLCGCLGFCGCLGLPKMGPKPYTTGPFEIQGVKRNSE